MNNNLHNNLSYQDILSSKNNMALLKNKGHYLFDHVNDQTLVLEWERVDPSTSRIVEKITEVSDLLANAYSQTEVEFAKVYPEAVSKEMFLIPLKHLVSDAENIDWQHIQALLKSNIKEFMVSADWRKYASLNEIHYFVTVKNRGSSSIIGVVQFIANHQFDDWNFKVALYDGVKPSNKNYGLEKLLMSSIFKLFPQTRRIFFHTRISNREAVSMHRGLGFTPFAGGLEYWVDLEYHARKSKILQNTAHQLWS